MAALLRTGLGVLTIFMACSALGSCFNLTLLHTNDVHSHFIEFNTHGGRCVDKLKEEKKCFGGFARQVTKAKEIRASRDNVLYLNGGDFYQGTVWYTLHRWQIVAELVNTLGIDAMSLGNHEFDDGLKGLFPFLRNLKPKVVVCNINASKVPEFAELVHPSTIIEVGGERIGVIGYLTPETKYLSSADDLEFEDEVECIKREARRLSTEEGLTKIMAVGHSGFAVDQNIAREVPEVDIVVGGHTNTFLYTGSSPSIEEPQGPYPVVIEREDGSRALVVQDFAFGKYMGFLEVVFDDEGKVTSWQGNPILLDSSVPEEPEILEILQPYGEEVKRRVRQKVGQTNVLLKGDRLTCRMKECNLGNFLADAALDYFIEQPTEKGWNFVAVSLWNAGGIRSSIDERMNEGNVTFEDIISVAPFGNTMDVVALKGKILKEVLENSVREYDLEAIDPPGNFLQVSGLRVTYNVSRPVGSRLVEALVRCADCRVPKFEPIDDEKVYWVVMSTYMTKGGDNFPAIKENSLGNRNTDELDIDIIIKYAQKNSPIITGLENRVTVLSSKDDKPPAEANDTNPNNAGESPDSHIEASSTEAGKAAPETITEASLVDSLISEINAGLEAMNTGLEEAGKKANKIFQVDFPILG
ncbi:protein 5NUC-like [Argiope bruennichi]|uniref:protein 5NUC-like n=1 Tax=Argiope bruennichi TaxID=94029 RepID=UPI0024940C90|nr:protein 5NUC-like [Argiope bruennichi]